MALPVSERASSRAVHEGRIPPLLEPESMDSMLP
jgi:hypothetical protein